MLQGEVPAPYIGKLFAHQAAAWCADVDGALLFCWLLIQAGRRLCGKETCLRASHCASAIQERCLLNKLLLGVLTATVLLAPQLGRQNERAVVLLCSSKPQLTAAVLSV